MSIDTIAHTVATLAPDIQVEIQKAENAQAEDLLRGDVVILGSGTGIRAERGQLNMYMHQLLMDRAKDVDLQGKAASFISLGMNATISHLLHRTFSALPA